MLSHRSTLLDDLEGRVLFNGTELSKDVWQSVVGYVLQADHLLPFLSVEETLRFAAALRLPPTSTKEEREARVAAVIAELGLQLCRHTLVGSRDVKGISGGEMRRLSIGVQMLTDPSVLLLDEPTSGLDSFTAYQITRTLLRIARRGRTVICSSQFVLGRARMRVSSELFIEHVVLIFVISVCALLVAALAQSTSPVPMFSLSSIAFCSSRQVVT